MIRGFVCDRSGDVRVILRCIVRKFIQCCYSVFGPHSTLPCSCQLWLFPMNRAIAKVAEENSISFKTNLAVQRK
jgi:hypothetical protein